MRHSLSIFSFRNKNIRAVFLVLMAAVFFLTGTRFLNHLYWQEDDWERILFHNFYEEQENIDVLCLGSSHVFCALDPEILDGKDGKNHFNLATSGQSVVASYYLLREAEKHNKIEKVYLELYYSCSTGTQGIYRERDSAAMSWKSTDYLRFSPLKLDAIAHMNPKQYFVPACFPYVRYRAYLTDKNWVRERILYKRTEDYKNYRYGDGMITYRDKGYYETTKELSELFCIQDRAPGEMYLTEDAERYLRKIVEYCQKKGIELVLYTSPMYELQPMATENYDGYAADIAAFAAQHDVPYYDFNLAREEALPIGSPEYFMDTGHMNTKGAELFTDFFYRTVSAPKQESEAWFYGSYREKLESGMPKVYGLYSTPMNEEERLQWGDGGKEIRVTVAAVQGDAIACQIFLTPDGGKPFMLQDFSENKVFFLTPEEHGVCQVFWRRADGPADSQTEGQEEEAASLEVRY